eukprot:COSAG01_NODE_915_length_12761_cov_33.161507_16_plen_161_part_00
MLEAAARADVVVVLCTDATRAVLPAPVPPDPTALPTAPMATRPSRRRRQQPRRSGAAASRLTLEQADVPWTDPAQCAPTLFSAPLLILLVLHGNWLTAAGGGGVALCCRAMEEESVRMAASSPRIDAAGDRDDVDDLRAQQEEWLAALATPQSFGAIKPQ